MRDSVTLLSLPVELLQRIATFIPCSSVLSLVQVNHRLRAVIYQHFIFEYLAKNSHVWAAVSSDPWKPGSLFQKTSLLETARIARTVEEAIRWAQVTVTTPDEARELASSFDSIHIAHASSADAGRWLPPLLALRHPAAFHASQPGILGLLLARSPPRTAMSEAFVNAALCFAATLLAEPPDPKVFLPDGLYYGLLRSVFPRDIQFCTLLSEKMNLRINRDIRVLPIWAESWAAIGIIVLLSAAAVDSQVRPPLPDPRRIPFHKLIDALPFLMSTGASPRFATSHVSTMTGPEFLADGEWIGLYTDARLGGHMPQQQQQHFAMSGGLMRGMRFECETNLDGAGPRTRIQGCSLARDDIGEFKIRGDVHKNGIVRMTKHYETLGFEWDWRGSVTPLGIAGFWGRERMSVGGHFWIWKSEWSR